MITPLKSTQRFAPIALALVLLMGACGGDDSGVASDAAGGDTENTDQSASEQAPDLTPQDLCDLLPIDEIIAAVDGSESAVEALDVPPQCSISYANSQAARDEGFANGTNLLVITPTSDDLEGQTGGAAMEVATQYVFFDSDPQPVDVGDDGSGLSDGKYLYFTTGGRIVGVAAGDGMTDEQLSAVAEIAATSLAP